MTGRAMAVSAAGALFLDADERVMLVRPTYKPGWDIPGGYVEAGESPLAACQREIREELGIVVALGPLLVVDWAPHPSEGDKVLYVFDGGVLRPEDLDRIQLAPDELAEYAYRAEDELSALLPERLVRRVRSAINARRNRRTLYLEHGAKPHWGTNP
jgi:ADP-ribose pyrophosphatase YjhB (NUDIX family)